MEAAIAIQVLPGLEDKEKVVAVVDKVIEYIISTGLDYTVGPFETTIEGNLDQLLDLVKEAQKIAIREGAPSVMSYIKINYSPDGGVLTTDEKTSKYN